MKEMVLVSGNEVLVRHIDIADSFFGRFKGLMGRKSLDVNEGLLLCKCPRVHTCFMRFPICVLYLSEDYKVVDQELIGPWKMGKKVSGAKHTLEVNPLAVPTQETGMAHLALIEKEG